MTELVIGHSRLRGGTVSLAGYKHCAVPILCSIIGLGIRARIGHVPDVEDSRVLRAFIEEAGGRLSGSNAWCVDTRSLRATELSAELTRRVHGSLYLVPALLGRFSEVRFPGAAGCRIGGGPGGERPFIHVIDVLRRFGAEFDLSGGAIVGRVRAFRACQVDILDYSDDPRRPNGPLVSGAPKPRSLPLHCVRTAPRGSCTRTPRWTLGTCSRFSRGPAAAPSNATTRASRSLAGTGPLCRITRSSWWTTSANS